MFGMYSRQPKAIVERQGIGEIVGEVGDILGTLSGEIAHLGRDIETIGASALGGKPSRDLSGTASGVEDIEVVEILKSIVNVRERIPFKFTADFLVILGELVKE